MNKMYTKILLCKATTCHIHNASYKTRQELCSLISVLPFYTVHYFTLAHLAA